MSVNDLFISARCVGDGKHLYNMQGSGKHSVFVNFFKIIVHNLSQVFVTDVVMSLLNYHHPSHRLHCFSVA